MGRHNDTPPTSSGTPDGLLDDLFHEIDCHRVTCGSEVWQVVVFGVHGGDGARWVQLAVDGPAPTHLLLRLSESAGSREALKAIDTWLTDTDHSEHLLVA